LELRAGPLRDRPDFFGRFRLFLHALLPPATFGQRRLFPSAFRNISRFPAETVD
jgi:hypothetical protein